MRVEQKDLPSSQQESLADEKKEFIGYKPHNYQSSL